MSGVSRCTASTSRAWTSSRARPAGIPMARSPCTPWATSAPLSETDLQHVDSAATLALGDRQTGRGRRLRERSARHEGFRQILVNAEGRSDGEDRSVARTCAGTAGLRRQPGAGPGPESPARAEAALGTHRGAVVALDPENRGRHRAGQYARVSYPTQFSARDHARGVRRADPMILTCHCSIARLRGAYPSGSTIKPAIGLDGLDRSQYQPPIRKCCATAPSSCRTASHIFPCRTRPSCVACSILTAAIANLPTSTSTSWLTRREIHDKDKGLASFGHGRLTGIDISGEKPGLLPSPAWRRRLQAPRRSGRGFQARR